uniref:Uncharacterized protein n=1 Tax=Timema cristinae TaxID=61476 RepID=A0A7R9CVB9_TIMCR|nr:unnamed protein product [Timema cristinae]
MKSIAVKPFYPNPYGSPMASLVLTDSSQLTSDSQHLDKDSKDLNTRIIFRSSDRVGTKERELVFMQFVCTDIRCSRLPSLNNATNTAYYYEYANELKRRKVEFRGSAPLFAWREREKTSLNTLYWDSNPNLSVTDSLLREKCSYIMWPPKQLVFIL